jgi:predicted phosphodiesterase
MKIIVTTDTHWGFSTKGDQANVVLLNKIKDEKKDALIHCGDWGSTSFADRYNYWKLVRDILGKDLPIGTIMGNHDCLDAETELLTKRGWIAYTEIKKDDSVYSYNIQEDRGQWDKIKNILIKETDKVLSTQVKQYSFTGTEGHRVLCSTRKGGEFKEYDYLPAKDVKGRIKIKSCASEKKENYNIPNGIIQLAAWILTDGYIGRKKDTHTGQYSIYQSKSIQNIINILHELNFTYTIYERNRDIQEICGKKLVKKCLPQKEIVLSNESAKIFSKYLYNKKFPEWAYKLSDKQFELFLFSILEANASKATYGTSHILYGTKEFLEEFQILCLLHNKRTLYKEDNRGDPRLYITNKDSVQYDASYHNIIIEQKQIVWCLEVPLTNFMVRRKGTTYFTGNCWAGKFFRLSLPSIMSIKYTTPISPYEVYVQNMAILREFDIVNLFNEMEIQGGSKTLYIRGFDGWYRDDVRTNDQHYIPGFRPVGLEWLQKRSHNQFEEVIKSLGEAKDKGKITMLVTHFGFIEEDAKNDWKARSSAMNTFGRTIEPQYFGANLKYEDFLDKVDYMCYGHSHSAFAGVAKNGTTKVLNVGSDYDLPLYKILTI